jgi:DNA-binding CsgD family transcriptional regulator
MGQMEDAGKLNRVLMALSGSVVLLVGVDLLTDYQSGSSSMHLLLEAILFTVSATVLGLGLKTLLQTKREVLSLQADVEQLNQEKEQWKEETHQLLAGLSVKIEAQFQNWQLTLAETEVGFLLLKGFSLQEIADIRGTKIKTVQQQSQSIYQKTGLASRSELAAFFLEDLLPPQLQSNNR